MFWIALELSIPKIGLNITLSLTVKNLDAFKFDGVAESDNTGLELFGLKTYLQRIYCCLADASCEGTGDETFVDRQISGLIAADEPLGLFVSHELNRRFRGDFQDVDAVASP